MCTIKNIRVYSILKLTAALLNTWLRIFKGLFREGVKKLGKVDPPLTLHLKCISHSVITIVLFLLEDIALDLCHYNYLKGKKRKNIVQVLILILWH